MIPVVTPDEMRRLDDAAIANGTPLEVLVERAGWAVARHAREMLGGTYGRRVTIVAGPGHNGDDGRVAARWLAESGVKVDVLDARHLPSTLADTDLVIDAAFGTGFRGEWNPPVTTAPVLAVDLPTGVDGLTGRAHGAPWSCARTVTFAAAKPGHFFHDGARLCGEIAVADIGLDVSATRAGIVTAGDVVTLWPRRRRDDHKWKHGALVVAGSPGMTGASALVSEAAMRSGAGIVHLVSPGVDSGPVHPIEVVRRHVGATWSDDVLAEDSRRFAVVTIGPGLGRRPDTMREVRRVAADSDRPLVVDGDALHAIDVETLARRRAPTILTPHDGEFIALTGAAPGDHRVAAARDLAARSGAVVLLKGPVTVVADASGEVRLVTNGDERLATAGSGDVLAGVVTGALAGGASPFEAASLAAWVCAEAGRRRRRHGSIASDVLAAVPSVLDDLMGSAGQTVER